MTPEFFHLPAGHTQTIKDKLWWYPSPRTGTEEPYVYCPGCNMFHRFWVNAINPDTVRDEDRHLILKPFEKRWDGNRNSPTFYDEVRYNSCHLTVKAGLSTYSEDSPHLYAGMTIPLPELVLQKTQLVGKSDVKCRPYMPPNTALIWNGRSVVFDAYETSVTTLTTRIRDTFPAEHEFAFYRVIGEGNVVLTYAAFRKPDQLLLEGECLKTLVEDCVKILVEG